MFELRFGREPMARYRVGPADDLYALGVTACRLVTGEYPELGEPGKDEAGIWQLDAVIPPPALLHNPRVDPQLRALILRMLSVHPAERGTTAELAEALEHAAENTPSESTQISARREALPLATGPLEEEAAAVPGRVHPQAHMRSWRPSLAMAAAALALAVGVWWSAPGQLVEEPAAARAEPVSTGQPDAGTVGLGDSAATASTEDSPKPPTPQAMAEDTLPEPQPGQTRPDAKGRCPHKRQVALNGGCWMKIPLDDEGCAVLSGHMHKGTCYVPIIPPGRRPTSSPGDRP